MNVTEKIEKPERRDSGKIPQTLFELFAKAKDNHWILTLVALGAGTGGENIAKQLGQSGVSWWMIAAGFGGMWLLRALDSIKMELRMGRKRFDEHDKKIDQQEEAHKAHIEEYHKKQPKAKSHGKMPSHKTPSTGGVPAIEPIN